MVLLLGTLGVLIITVQGVGVLLAAALRAALLLHVEEDLPVPVDGQHVVVQKGEGVLHGSQQGRLRRVAARVAVEFFGLLLGHRVVSKYLKICHNNSSIFSQPLVPV